MKIGVGDAAPRFVLKSQSGQALDLADVLGKKEVVLYFYPKDNTPGCTTEAKAFRDRYESFRDMGAEVIGISSDTVDSHQEFAAKCNLPFTILSDEGGRVRKLYGVPSSFGLFPGRVSYVIDTKGIVRHIFDSQMNPAKHVEEAMKMLERIKKERESLPPY
ncbi:MAG: peroxiredoxin [Nitrososphaerota archaeon]|nr:peroxiredoxin [Nitrososphaerota archaeon]